MINVFLTVSRSGKVITWLDEPVRKDNRYWSGRLMLINSIFNKKANKFAKDAGLTFDSEAIPLAY